MARYRKKPLPQPKDKVVVRQEKVDNLVVRKKELFEDSSNSDYGDEDYTEYQGNKV